MWEKEGGNYGQAHKGIFAELIKREREDINKEQTEQIGFVLRLMCFACSFRALQRAVIQSLSCYSSVHFQFLFLLSHLTPKHE